MSRTFKRALATAAIGAGAVLAPAGAAHAAAPVTTASSPCTLTFVPPRMGRVVVVIGPVIIGGKVISPGVHVENAPLELPTLTVTLPGC
ncbi:hypothetical protein OM076_35600 [Solirubrobacter ginsenosidimutans]|uniref:Uncharacterized protein n=1 Tax=Solirubrobacter ginsenosidimutans TaxID=490573 RepID=A0A9X3S5H7_9ACTN|nr:hypothetical protein [Solirubrobacter ginsenosidimutans]MDA0165647.1 hypothetical protein [Solirubrobacter ginsenosidimutans]